MRSVSHHISHDVTPKDGFRRFEVITGERRRRAWPVEEKLAIVAESFSTPTSISDVARRHQLNRNQLFQWRAQFRRGELGGAAVGPFVPLSIADACAPGAPAPDVAAEAMIEVVIGEATVRIPPRADETALRRVLAAVRDLR